MANKAGTQLSIGNKQSMNADAAAYWNALTQRIFDETKLVILPTEGTRTYARQKELYDGYRAGRIDPSTGQRYNPAWSPDSPNANHLSGRAVDVGSGVGYRNRPEYTAFRKYAGEYGFRETVKGEPWHFEWRADWVKTPVNTTASTNKIPIEQKIIQGAGMIHLLGSSERGEALVDAGYYKSLTGEESRYAPIVADKTIDARANNRLYDLVREMCTKGQTSK